MTTGRRLAVIVAAASLVLAGLAACTDDDGWQDDAVAAYVAGVEITEAELDAIADELRAELGAEIEGELASLAESGDLDEQALADHERRRYDELEQQVSVNRTRSLEMRILTVAVDRYTTSEGIPVGQPQREQQAFDLGLSEDNAYVGVVAEFFTVMAALQADTGPRAPTESDQREVYDHLVETGLTSAPFEEARQVLDEELMGRQAALRNRLVDIVAKADVRVHPRYDLVYRVPVTVGSGESWLTVPLGGGG